MKKVLAVVFGGRSVEHDVSIITGKQFIENIDTEKYSALPVYIARDGKWYMGDALLDLNIYIDFEAHMHKLQSVYLSPEAGSQELTVQGKKKGMFSKERPETVHIDCVVPAIHGMHGEDGTLQGMLEMCDMPYTGAGVLGSAVGMDKILMKRVFQGCGLPVLPFVYFTRQSYLDNEEATLSRVEESLGYPVYVKPANLGSSIGISRAADRDALLEAIEVAINYDRRILVEKSVEDIMEVNCSCITTPQGVQASVCEQPVAWQEFLTFDDKYLRGGKSGGGMENLQRKIPADISDEMAKRVQQISMQVYSELDCKGVVRIDYMIDKAQDSALYINEINITPGSFSFYLWEPMGVSYAQLIDILVADALSAHREKSKNAYAYASNILRSAPFGKGGKASGK